MPAVFISHSSADNRFASEVMDWLAEQGLDNIFLDLDSNAGIVVGEDWERRLYEEVSRCHAVILIVTQDWIDSKWCFAEFSMARSQGKIILPVISAEDPPVEGGATLLSIQTVKWDEDGKKRLSAQLRTIAFDIARGHRLMPGRAPYPGILSFEPQDAAVFFGRDIEIRAMSERLEARRVQGGSRLLLVVGPSGSGKSSLVKAGVVPWLEKDAGSWIVVPPIRPGPAPLTKLAKSLELLDLKGKSWETIREDLIDAPLETMQDIVLHLRRGQARDASILVSIDQFEELFSQTDPIEQAAVLKLLEVGSTQSLPFIFLATIRSDLVGNILQNREFNIRHDVFMVGQLPLERLPQVIEGPARVAAISLEQGFTQRIIRDAQTAEALPLLAFTMREMYDRFGDDRRFTIVQYEALGDPANNLSPLENSVRRKAEEMIRQHVGSREELLALKDAFVNCLVRVNIDGVRVRRATTFKELPKLARPLIRRLIDGRLLTSGDDGGGETIEVAHEALFRAWPQLRDWLDEEQDFLISRRNIESAQTIWRATPDDKKDMALLSGIMLEKAKNWAQDNPRRLGRAHSFIEASIQKDENERERRRRRRRRFLVSMVVIALGFALLSVSATIQWYNASAARGLALENGRAAAEAQRRAEDRFVVSLGAVASGLVAESPRLALFLAAEAIARGGEARPGFLARSAILKARQELASGVPYPNGSPLQVGDALSIAFDPATAVIAVGDRDGRIQLFDPDTRDVLNKPIQAHEGGILALAFDAGGRLLASSGADGAVRLWTLDDRKMASGTTLAQFRDVAWSVDFNAEGGFLAASSEAGIVQVWDVRGDVPMSTARLERGEDVLSVALSNDGNSFVAGTGSGTIFSWDVDRGREIFPAIEDVHGSDILKLSFSANGSRFASVTSDGISSLFSFPGGTKLADLFEGQELIRSAVFDRTGTYVVGGGDDGKLVFQGLDDTDFRGRSVAGHTGPISDVALGAGPHHLVSLGRDQNMQHWTVFEPVPLARARTTDASARGVAVSRDGGIVAAADVSGSIYVWMDSAAEPRVFHGHSGQVWSLAISEDGASMLSADRSGEVRQWTLESGDVMVLAEAGENPVWWIGYIPGTQLAAAATGTGIEFFSLSPDMKAPAAIASSAALMSASVSRDGYLLAYGSEEGVATIRDLRSGQTLHEINVLDDVIWNVEFSQVGTVLAVAASDETVSLWDVETGRQIAEFGGHGGGATDVAFLADGSTIAVTDRWGGLHIWDAVSFDRLSAPIQAHVGTSWRLAASQAANLFVTSGEDGQIRIWDILDPDLACELGAGAIDEKITGKFFGPDMDRFDCLARIGTAHTQRWR